MLFLFVVVVGGVFVDDSSTKNEGVAFNFIDNHLTGSEVDVGKHTFSTVIRNHTFFPFKRGKPGQKQSRL
jgi:hypothetical protein